MHEKCAGATQNAIFIVFQIREVTSLSLCFTGKLSFSCIVKSEGSVESALKGKSFAFHLGFFGMGSEINFCKTVYYPLSL